MRQFIIGGIAATLAAPFTYLWLTDGPESASALWRAFGGRIPVPQEKQAYMQSPFYYHTGYDLKAPFLTEYSKSSHVRSFAVYREEPVARLTKADYARICVSDLGDESFDVSVRLNAAARDTLAKSFNAWDDRFSTGLSPEDGTFAKRYYVEAGGNRMVWFWVNEEGAQAYDGLASDAFDFTLTVPFSQLYNFQYYLQDDMTDQPIDACNADLDLNTLPMWQVSVDESWTR